MLGLDGVYPNERRLLGRRSGVDKPIEPALLPPVRFLLLRIVIVAGIWLCAAAPPLRGDARGGVTLGAGSFDRAVCTLCSRFCILPISPRIWYSDPDFGRPGPWELLAWVLRVVLRGNEGVAWLEAIEPDGPREYLEILDEYCGRGVVLESAIDALDFGTWIAGAPTAGTEWSDVGGEGGVGVSDMVEEADLVGGVATVGEEVVVGCDRSDMAD